MKMEFGCTTQEPPKVSIGMPVYNGEKYIRDALESLLQQTYTNYELVVSDNASSDRTGEICQEYAGKDERISYFRQERNIGAAANFQFVLDHARANLFMWAAYDDEWKKNYLMDAVILLDDDAIDFSFSTFELVSIRLNISKRFDNEIFRFVESTNRKHRVMQFLALHHDSHKCNIVYSLFRVEFLRAALKVQGIENDGALGAVILSLGRGIMLNDALFRKRYPMLWPGSLSFFFAWFPKRHSTVFELAKEVALKRLCQLFPEYINEIKAVFDRYHPYSHDKLFRICPIDNEFDSQERNNVDK